MGCARLAPLCPFLPQTGDGIIIGGGVLGLFSIVFVVTYGFINRESIMEAEAVRGGRESRTASVEIPPLASSASSRLCGHQTTTLNRPLALSCSTPPRSPTPMRCKCRWQGSRAPMAEAGAAAGRTRWAGLCCIRRGERSRGSGRAWRRGSRWARRGGPCSGARGRRPCRRRRRLSWGCREGRWRRREAGEGAEEEGAAATLAPGRAAPPHLTERWVQEEVWGGRGAVREATAAEEAEGRAGEEEGMRRPLARDGASSPRGGAAPGRLRGPGAA